MIFIAKIKTAKIAQDIEFKNGEETNFFKKGREVSIEDMEALQPDNDVRHDLKCPTDGCPARVSFHRVFPKSYFCTWKNDKHSDFCDKKFDYEIKKSKYIKGDKSTYLQGIEKDKVFKHSQKKYHYKNPKSKKPNPDKENKDPKNNSSPRIGPNTTVIPNSPSTLTSNPNEKSSVSNKHKRMIYRRPRDLDKNIVGTVCLHGFLSLIKLYNNELKLEVKDDNNKSIIYSSPSFFSSERELDVKKNWTQFETMFNSPDYKRKEIEIDVIIDIVPGIDGNENWIYSTDDVRFGTKNNTLLKEIYELENQ